MSNHWDVVIGLEIHAQLKTKSKIFSSDSAEFGAGDNSHVHPVSLGLPGALPVLNEKVVELAIATGLAFHCDIQPTSLFARKNYFYPDMPKGYQISQFDRPICKNGFVEFLVEGEPKKIRLERIHLEEDAGKSSHFGNYTLINLNRAGVPLLEIVSQPEMQTPFEAAEYSRAVRQTLRYIGVCDGNLEEGSLRVDCNISVKPKGDKKLGSKVEIKNINSFRFIEKSLEYEIQRQIDLRESGQTVEQETRLYDSVKNMTFSMRKKEDAHDYRYFPEPDLAPCSVTDQQIAKVKSQMSELPRDRFLRYQNHLGLSDDDAVVLTAEKEVSDYFEKVFELTQDAKLSSNWVRGDLLGFLNDKKININNESVVSPENLAALIGLVQSEKISGKIAKTVFKEMCLSGDSPESIVEKRGLEQISEESTILRVVEDVIVKHTEQFQQLLDGKQKVRGFFVGQIMKATRGQASPEVVNRLLDLQIEKRK